MKRFTLCVLFMAAVATVGVAESSKEDLKQAAKAVAEAFAQTSFTAKVDLLRYGDHFVTPDGEPHPGKSKKQGRGASKTAIQLDDGVKVHAGEVGHSIQVYLKGRDEVAVGFNQKPGAKLNPALAHILYERPVTTEDLTPEKIARAVESLVVIQGYEPGAELAAAFDEVLESASPGESADSSSVNAAQARPVLVSVVARVEPGVVRAGGEASLVLEYEVSGAATVAEGRSLSLGGTVVPSFPVREEIGRAAGVFVSSYRQPLPRTAQAGIYVFQGEVCVAADCIRRSVPFEVVAP
jgi:hypothetical protein